MEADAGRGSSLSSLRTTVLTSPAALTDYATDWDRLVLGSPRPSPFLLHAWIDEWWRHYGGGHRLHVHLALQGEALIGALPLFVERRGGVRILRFVGGRHSALADLLIDEHHVSASAALATAVRTGPWDFADLFGLPEKSRLAPLLDDRLVQIERIEAPVLDLSPGWEAVYRAKTTSKKRNHHARRRRQLASAGHVETRILREPHELEAALEDAFRLHALRFSGRSDRSEFTTPTGRRFHRAVLARLAREGVARIAAIYLDGRMVAYHYYFLLRNRMYVHNLAFDPEWARWSPGLLATLAALEAASEEKVVKVEFLGGTERYKLELADGFEPLREGIGLAQNLRGHALARTRRSGLELYLSARRSPRLRRVRDQLLAAKGPVLPRSRPGAER